MADNLIIEIMLKYARQEQPTPKDCALLKKWQAQWGEGRPLQDLIHDREWLEICLYRQQGLPSRRDWQELQQQIAATGDPLPVMRTDSRWVGGMISAAVFIIVAITAHFVKAPGRNTPISSRNEIARTDFGGWPSEADGEAELICQNGKKIQIAGISDNGVVAEEGNVIIRRLNRNTLQYEVQSDKLLMPMNHFFYAGKKNSYKLLFPGGDCVRLQKGSSIQYSPALRSKGRPVMMKGKAWFSVAKNSQVPLTLVLANGTTVNVLGTEFHVSSSPEDKETKVCVYRGAVRVQQGLNGVTLRDSDEVTVREQVLQPKRKISDFNSLLAGTDIDQHFHFDNCSLTDAVQQIADYYHADVLNPTNTQGITVKGNPAQSLPLKSLLKDIELIESGNAYVGLSNKKILISPMPQP